MLKLYRLIRWCSLASGVIEYSSERGPPKDHSNKVWFQLYKQFQRRFLCTIPIGSYVVKTMSADVGGLGLQAGSSDTILKGDHLSTILPKFDPN